MLIELDHNRSLDEESNSERRSEVAELQKTRTWKGEGGLRTKPIKSSFL